MIYNIEFINNFMLPLITSIITLLINYHLKKNHYTAYGDLISLL